MKSMAGVVLLAVFALVVFVPVDGAAVRRSDQIQAIAASSVPVWSIQLRYPGDVSPEQTKVAPISDGGAYFAYEADEFDPPDCNSYWPVICRLDARGRVLWHKELRGIRESSSVGVRLITASDGGCLYVADQRTPALVVKLSGAGQVLWAKTYSITGRSLGVLFAAPGPSGDFYLACSVDTGASFAMARVDSSGEPRWCRLVTSGLGTGHLKSMTGAGGGVFLAGVLDSYDGFWAAALDSEGGLSWMKGYAVDSFMSLSGAFEREDCGFIVGLSFHKPSPQWWVAGAMRLDRNGDAVWCRSFDGEYTVFRRASDDGGDWVLTQTRGLQKLLPDGRSAATYPVSFQGSLASAGAAAEGGFFLAARDGLVKTDAQGWVESCAPTSGTGAGTLPEPFAPQSVGAVLSDLVLIGSPADIVATMAPLTISLVCRDPNYVYLNMKSTEGGTIVPPAGLTGYPKGTSVAIQAAAADFYEFSGWEGDVPEEQRTLSSFNLAMDGDKTLLARFLKIQAPLNLTGNRLRSAMRPWAFDALTWTPHPENMNIESYRVFAVRDGIETLLGETPAAFCQYVHRRASPGEAASYTVCAVTASGREGYRATIEVR